MNQEDKLLNLKYYTKLPRTNKIIHALIKHFKVKPDNICSTLDLQHIERLLSTVPRIGNCFIVSPKAITEKHKEQLLPTIPGCLIEIVSAFAARQTTLQSIDRIIARGLSNSRKAKEYKKELIKPPENICCEQEIGYYRRLEDKIPMYYFIRDRYFWQQAKPEIEFICANPDFENGGYVTAYDLASETNSLPQAPIQLVGNHLPMPWERVEIPTHPRPIFNVSSEIAQWVAEAGRISMAAVLEENHIPSPPQPIQAIHLNGDLDRISRTLWEE